jgi:hypothetical protein
VKFEGDFVLLAKEETILQGLINRLRGTGKCCGLEINVDKSPTQMMIDQNNRRMWNISGIWIA